jgi:D-alanyl-D-alanine carboxypeptidase
MFVKKSISMKQHHSSTLNTVSDNWIAGSSDRSFCFRKAAICVAAAIALLLPVQAAHAVPQLLIDETSNTIVVSRDSDNLWHPASLTKLMTVHLAFDAIESGRLALDTPVVISENAASKPPSKLGLAPGKSIPLEEALRITITRSMNDLATAIGETVAGGSEAEFVAMMNAEAKRLGMNSTHFTNASGLPDDAQVTTARDLALLAVAITRKHGRFDSYFGTERVTYGSRILKNTNTLLTKLPGVDGMKTGYVCSSGFNLINRITIKGRRYISVVMGAASVKEREMMTGRMLALVARGPLAGPPLVPGNAFNDTVPDMSRYGCGKSYGAGKQMPLSPPDKGFVTALQEAEKKAKEPTPFEYGFIGGN